jgi:long-chain acyl-CoA synthetase
MMNYCLFGRFQETAKAHFNDIACQIKEGAAYQTYTYGQLHNLSLKVAAFLSQEGIEKQERVAILLENSPYWPAIYFGIIAIGATAVPIDLKLTPYEVNNVLRDSGAKIIFTSEELHLPFKDFLKNILSFKKAVFYPFSEVTQAKAGTDFIAENKSGDIASILYTSGTTASPKGVMLTHKNFCSNFDSIAKLALIGAQDNVLSLLPLHHSYPFMVTLLLPLLSGGRVTFLNSLKPEDLLQCLRETQATVLVGVPQLYYLLHKAILEKLKKPSLVLSILKVTGAARKLFRLNVNKILLKKLHRNFGPSLRFFASGGARLEPKVAYELTLLGFTILEGYGLTETAPVVTFNPICRIKLGSVGLPIPEVKIRIHNPDSEHIGELVIQGPNVMKGYYKKPKETAEVLKDDWFYSGDLGYIDKDGYIYLTGRSKEVIVLSSGKNIYPEEIEAHYLKSPYIKEICVLEATAGGLSSLHALVFPNIDYFRKTKEVNIQGKIRWLLENLSKELPSYKRIMGFTVAREELPRTRLGKLKRYEIKARNLAQAKFLAQAPAERPASASGANEILEFLSQELKTRVGMNDHLELDLGIDSLRRVELAIALEKKFNINVPDTGFSEIFTIKELLAKIAQLYKSPEGDKPEGSACLPARQGLPSHRQSHKPEKGEMQIPQAKPAWSQIIQEAPAAGILDKINLRPGASDKAFSFIILNFFNLLFRTFCFLRIKGKENLPTYKPFIICPNHTSYLDGFIVAASSHAKTGVSLFFLGYSGYFLHPLIKWAVKIARLIAIDPAVNLTDAMQAAAYVLRNNKSLCIFPEGERSIDGEVKEFKKGVGILIKETDALVVPCYIRGSYPAWPRGKFLPRPYPIKIIFGKACAGEELKEAGLKYHPHDDYEAIALGLREKVIGLA